jgi:tetratricopeptide (TPR) repeat protein
VQPGALETGRDVFETMPPADRGPGSPPVPEEPAAQEPAQQPAAEGDLGEIWAEAEFYFQQGLFHEAKKHYTRIIQMNPGESKAIERLEELSREEEDTEDFAKLAEAVEELEAAPPPEAHAREEMPFSETDEEAVRSLMKEISQLAQAPKKPSHPAKEVSAPPTRPEALPEQPYPAKTPQKAFDAVGRATPGKEENYFDLAAELAADSGASAPTRQEKQAGDFFDLASELRDELGADDSAPRAASDEEQSLDDIFEEFKHGMEKQAAREDEDTHYNLGVAYREMGLLDDAIAEFIMTTDNEPKFIQSRYMLGLCYMEKGEYQKAAGEIQNAVDSSEATGVAAQNLIGMHYDLGYAYQVAGNSLSALREFQIVQNLDPQYRDIAEKIKELREGEFVSLDQLKDDIEKEISAKFLEEGQRIEREEKNRKNEKIRS